MANPVGNPLARLLRVVACAALLAAPAALPSDAKVDVRAGFGAHAGFNPAADMSADAAHEEQDITLVRPPMFVRDCIADDKGLDCRYRLAPTGNAFGKVTTAGTPVVDDGHFAMVGLLVVALGFALALTGMFWRHLALSIAPDDERQRRQRKTRRR